MTGCRSFALTPQTYVKLAKTLRVVRGIIWQYFIHATPVINLNVNGKWGRLTHCSRPNPDDQNSVSTNNHRLDPSILRSKELDSAWPLRSRGVTLLPRYYGPLRHPVAFSPFPVSTVIGPTSLQGFLPGATRTFPVSIVSLLPCRHHYPAGVDYPFSQTEIAHAAFASFVQARPPVI